jgi:hypothetical protein
MPNRTATALSAEACEAVIIGLLADPETADATRAAVEAALADEAARLAAGDAALAAALAVAEGPAPLPRCGYCRTPIYAGQARCGFCARAALPEVPVPRGSSPVLHLVPGGRA